MEKLDHPIVFAIAITLIVIAIAHVGHWAALKANWTSGAAFFSLP